MNRVFSFSVTVVCFVVNSLVFAQFAPIVGQSGTTAMYKDSSAFVGWATACHVVKGLQDVSAPSNGYTNVGDSTMALGIAGSNGVVSLGDGGYAIMRFTSPITDGVGPDLAVFENGFDDSFLELAFVEVSSNGIDFFRFPATSNTDTTVQTGSFGLTDATKLNNLAGKYRALYGTPFDLSDIPNTSLLNKQAITYVKVIDVVGCIQNQYCSRDKDNHKVNDPWPTAFGSSGFDLDAVGVIHQQPVGIDELELAQVVAFPNPVTNEITIVTELESYSVTITSLLGQEVLVLNVADRVSRIDVSSLHQGVYTITIRSNNKQRVIKMVKGL